MKEIRLITFLTIFLVLVTILFMSALWSIDISASAIANGLWLKNIYGLIDPNFTYHLALFILLFVFTGTIMFLFIIITDLLDLYSSSQFKKHPNNTNNKRRKNHDSK